MLVTLLPISTFLIAFKYVLSGEDADEFPLVNTYCGIVILPLLTVIEIT